LDCTVLESLLQKTTERNSKMPKKCNNSDLLIRIDERMNHLTKEDIPEIKQDIKDIKNKQNYTEKKLTKYFYRLETVEKDVKKSAGFKITGFLRGIMGK